jgi:hypothetical protein
VYPNNPNTSHALNDKFISESFDKLPSQRYSAMAYSSSSYNIKIMNEKSSLGSSTFKNRLGVTPQSASTQSSVLEVRTSPEPKYILTKVHVSRIAKGNKRR